MNYGEKHPPPVIEVAERVSELLPRRVERAGTCFSGGIDSYATLRLNEMAYPVNHPYRIREGVLASGLEQDALSRFRFRVDRAQPRPQVFVHDDLGNHVIAHLGT